MSEKEKLIREIKSQMLSDKSLPLRKGAHNLVFGDGDPEAEIIFIGEGPGYWEDQKGTPFVGNAGALLNQLLASVNLNRENVFITNVVHYRPPENRDPEPSELDAFRPYLDRIIEIIKPKIIVTLGRFSMAKFLPGVTISRVHGKEKQLKWEDNEIWVIPMYHPAAGLRSTDIKRQLFEDFKRIPEIQEKTRKSEEVNQGTKVQQMKLV
ncbi:hypothetical protein A2962_02745 [Candidatus Woesebacteria bacterium RIFCSPLOWO2_01_FULL_39_61]|uniref:Type-4 uracil-DNA glycosylase n=1 Tax=Candidatus Woesebacteria bacterium RIFCSPHIGHO2_02_FULL_39_13 TaxID=1802505 RepID=A0A1F7Z1Q2_9BACT|nr:MAG: hypothetical protein A2692_04985 [Candidatus Woesebacteria bacterium RIFCSPHIGHO2_01_FULL_39_95]OGM33543.1 MAG: hypothetical protein A3D01_01145 [Candidatus Woesebacteria bacterium RIFCSPHIGHO2_02_FULL_39_13]OGM38621.1 MAG: hypothetical protein A3E13_04565 [Candidatus Woesebacteria bacterium RIFCSPHIGHO2_12_FULL_40_20]OGM67312.1 MAG: hypothetical protein A2962_02745 [Candidatus Woesebacteria bacterium RIFCSPLOWO2_01_FULL_39_61]OGM74202.1 MAG: hypothetical protein A3H19_05995 [Candidatus